MSSAVSETPEAWSIGRVLVWSADFLRAKGMADSPRLDAEVLLGHALGLERIQLYTQYDKPLSSAEREPFKAFLQRRGRGEPVAYITGVKEFMGLSFHVTPAVLIPRPDTEVLVEQVLAKLKDRQGGLRILDVGTGSGCIATALALKLQAAEVMGWDVDEAALANARSNAQRLQATVVFTQCDALTQGAWVGDQDVDAIVSNPPYIRPEEAAALALPLGFEPEKALFAPPDGLSFYRALAAWAPMRLVADGLLSVEIGSTQAAEVTLLLAAAGWRDVVVRKDWGRLDRVVMARRPRD